MSLVDNFNKLRAEIPKEIEIVAVSKTKPNEAILELYNHGHLVFGENKVQELTQKYNELPKDIKWHLIGHLQTNKVKYIAPFVTLIHSVDKIKLLKEINKQALKNNRIIDCLLEIKIAQEDSKFGLSFNEAEQLIQSSELKDLNNVRIIGLMGMATYTFEDVVVLNEFQSLKSFFDKIKQTYFAEKEYFKELSMGMSGDYKIAINTGATIVRVGSIIFGSRK